MLNKVVRKSQGGFTLMELMVTLAVIAILAVIAVPAYNDHTSKARRSDAKSMLTTIAARQEQYFMDNKTYANSPADLGYTVDGDGEATSTDGYYKIRIDRTSAVEYVAEAQPVNADSQCQQFTLDQNGARGVEAGSNPVTSAPTWASSKCW